MTIETIEVMAIVDAQGTLTAQVPQSIEAGEYRVVMMMIERAMSTKGFQPCVTLKA